MPRNDLVFRKPDGTTIERPLQQAEITESLDEVSMATAVANREDVADIDPQETKWDILIKDPSGGFHFAGPIRDIVHNAVTAETQFIVDSPERFAMDAEPGPIDDTYSAVSDTVIVEDAIDDTPRLTRGTITSQQSGLTFSFNHATNALKIRRVRETADGEVFYNYDYSVDYVGRLGTDRGKTSGTPLRVGPVDGNVTDMRVTESGGKGQRANHLRVIGKGRSYVDVVAPTYTAGDRKIWGRFTLRETNDEATLEEWGTSSLAELNQEWTEVKATLTGVDVALGDTLHVYYPEEKLDRDLRVIEIRRQLTEQGENLEVTLSNRTKLRREDIERMGESLAEERRTVPPSTDTGPATEEGIPAGGSTFWGYYNYSDQGTAIQGIGFADAGAWLNVINYNPETIFQYALDTPYSLATATLTNTLDVSAQTTGPAGGPRFNSDGTKMYHGAYADASVFEYTLTTPYDISTASLNYTLTLAAGGARTLAFGPNGTHMYLANAGSNAIEHYTLATAWDLSTATLTDSQSVPVGFPEGIWVDATGHGLITNDGEHLYYHALDTQWEVSTMRRTGAFWGITDAGSLWGLDVIPSENIILVADTALDAALTIPFEYRTPSEPGPVTWNTIAADDQSTMTTAGSGPVTGLSLAWSSPSKYDVAYGNIVVDDESVYALLRDSERHFSEDERLVSLARADGSVNWDYSPTEEVGDRVEYDPDNDQLITYSEFDGYVLAIDASTGTENWRFQMADGAADYGLRYMSDGMVYAGDSGDLGGYVYQLDAATGTEQWRTFIRLQLPDDFEYLNGGTLSPDQSTFYAACEYDGIVAIDTVDGSVIWNAGHVNDGASFGYSHQMNPLYVDDKLISVDHDSYGLHAFNAADGTLAWNETTRDYWPALTGHPTDGEKVFVASDLPSPPTLYAYPIDGGSAVWSASLDQLAENNGIYYSEGSDMVYYQDRLDDGLRGHSAVDGSRQFTYTGHAFDSNVAFAIDQGAIFISGGSGSPAVMKFTES